MLQTFPEEIKEHGANFCCRLTRNLIIGMWDMLTLDMLEKVKEKLTFLAKANTRDLIGSLQSLNEYLQDLLYVRKALSQVQQHCVHASGNTPTEAKGVGNYLKEIRNSISELDQFITFIRHLQECDGTSIESRECSRSFEEKTQKITKRISTLISTLEADHNFKQALQESQSASSSRGGPGPGR